MASVINIGADNASDQFYRYKMPKLQARVSRWLHNESDKAGHVEENTTLVLGADHLCIDVLHRACVAL